MRDFCPAPIRKYSKVYPVLLEIVTTNRLDSDTGILCPLYSLNRVHCTFVYTAKKAKKNNFLS